jgi:hypothetical protein
MAGTSAAVTGAIGRQGGQRLVVGVYQELAAQPLGRSPGQQRGQRGLESFLPPPVGLGVKADRRRRRGAQGPDHRLEGFLGGRPSLRGPAIADTYGH